MEKLIPAAGVSLFATLAASVVLAGVRRRRLGFESMPIDRAHEELSHLHGPARWRIANKPFLSGSALPYRVRIGTPNIWRYDRVPGGDAEADDRAMVTFPSLSFSEPAMRDMPLSPIEPVAADCFEYFVPWLSADGDCQLIEIPVPADGKTSVYGTGEVSGTLERTGAVVMAWNTDNFGHEPNLPLYQTMPWLIVTVADGSCVGVLVDTSFRTVIDLSAEGALRFKVFAPENVNVPVVVMGPYVGPLPLFTELALLIGRTPLPPLYALGFHQCRWSYESDAVVRHIADEFRRNCMPCDVVWMDIDYMTAFKVFTFGPRFPDPAATNEHLHSRGFHSVWMLDPGIAQMPRGDSSYDVARTGTAAGVWIEAGASDRSPAVGSVWPGPCTFPDFTSSAVRAWWATHFPRLLALGVDGVWNDMNEPAVFGQPSRTLPLTAVHNADRALGGRSSHARMHNVYGMLMARASFEAMQAAAPERRPFVLTRANAFGGHRYAATWTGDNNSSWAHLQESIPMALNLALSGQSFVGPDIGGFTGDADPRLFGRWMAICSLFPFARAHTIKDSRPHEPWAFGDHTTTLCRIALLRRYRLLPHLYSLFERSAADGSPVMRPMWFMAPAAAALRAAEDGFLLGDGLLVLCNTAEASVRPPHLLHGRIIRGEFESSHIPPAPIELVSGEREHASDLPLVLVRPGAIVVAGPPLQSTMYRTASDELTMFVCLDGEGSATGYYYNDEGDGAVGQADACTALVLRAKATGGVLAVTWMGPRAERVDAFGREVHVQVVRSGAAPIVASTFFGAGAVFVSLE